MRNGMIRRLPAMTAAATLLAAPAAAQLPSASTPALGLADNYTALARGFNAVAWNPANLGLSGNPGASLTLLTLRGTNGFGPITLADLSDYSDAVVPITVKQDWLARIIDAGGQTGAGEATATWGAFQAGRFGMQFSTSTRGVTDLSPGVAELVMFGNAGRAGSGSGGGAAAASLDLSGSSLAAYAYTTAAASYAQPIALPGGRLSLGVTVKWTAGHALAFGENSTGASSSDPIALRLDFPLVQTVLNPDSLKFDNGSGFGVDVGAGLELGRWTFGAALQNAFNNFEWDASALRYRPLALELTEQQTETETDAVAFGEAPASVRERVEQLRFDPVVSLGAMVRPTERLAVTGDFRKSSETAMSVGPVMHAGAGLQYHVASWLPVRLGGAVVSMGEGDSGYQLGAGLGLNIGGWNIGGSFARRDTDRFGTANTLMVTLFGTGLN